MKSTTQLTGAHQRTYDTIFRHPAAHNLGWHDVHALFRQLGEVEVEPNGNMKVTRNGEVLVLHAPRTKEVGSTDELMALRHFLERSEPRQAETKEPSANWLLIIDHREARIFRSLAPGAVAQQIRPPASADLSRVAANSRDFSRGQEKPDPNSFFEPVAAVLKGADKILVFGGGTGTSNEMEQFAQWLATHRPELVQRVVGTVVVDERHLTEPQLLAQAREFFEMLPVA